MSNVAYNLTCKGSKLLPRIGRNPERVKLYSELSKMSLKPVKKVEYRLDPFHPKALSIRELMHRFSQTDMTATNRDVFFKTEVLSNMEEPKATITFFNNYMLVFNTSNLSLYDMAFHFNQISVKFIEEMQ